MPPPSYNTLRARRGSDAHTRKAASMVPITMARAPRGPALSAAPWGCAGAGLGEGAAAGVAGEAVVAVAVPPAVVVAFLAAAAATADGPATVPGHKIRLIQ